MPNHRERSSKPPIGPTKKPHVMSAMELQSHENPTANHTMTKGMTLLERGKFNRENPGYGDKRGSDVRLKKLFGK